ncbi:uncharacterized protein MYCFIDRAFT_177576 [Pseudocercospora fijiensis CIRAD86]|uniref:Uncharacterized protein n=1 Tax=Pseudocercospora fijiensis (strain CIRAD86) TaxID=383855 RepID=M2ZNH2_PSEFD|nr:uncharacterized protein MYCFIDRAFT_177576 [Pseudocercospora fijiensis CIRAD86]EME80644.1 hypothetical protein MYCFIDRAFT_177576 [Pseudocercospora fijiensis CIRAD86]
MEEGGRYAPDRSTPLKEGRFTDASFLDFCSRSPSYENFYITTLNSTPKALQARLRFSAGVSFVDAATVVVQPRAFAICLTGVTASRTELFDLTLQFIALSGYHASVVAEKGWEAVSKAREQHRLQQLANSEGRALSIPIPKFSPRQYQSLPFLGVGIGQNIGIKLPEDEAQDTKPSSLLSATVTSKFRTPLEIGTFEGSQTAIIYQETLGREVFYKTTLLPENRIQTCHLSIRLLTFVRDFNYIETTTMRFLAVLFLVATAVALSADEGLEDRSPKLNILADRQCKDPRKLSLSLSNLFQIETNCLNNGDCCSSCCDKNSGKCCSSTLIPSNSGLDLVQLSMGARDALICECEKSCCRNLMIDFDLRFVTERKILTEPILETFSSLEATRTLCQDSLKLGDSTIALAKSWQCFDLISPAPNEVKYWLEMISSYHSIAEVFGGIWRAKMKELFTCQASGADHIPLSFKAGEYAVP